MDEKFSGQVDELLEKFDERRSEHQQKLDAANREAAAFLEAFLKFRSEVALPLFDTVAQHLRDHGHDCDVEQPDYDVSEYGNVKDAKITLIIYPVGMARHSRPVHEFPSLSITAAKNTQLVRLDRTSGNPRDGMPLGRSGEIQLSMLTPKLVQRELLKLLGEVFPTPPRSLL